MSVTLQQHFQQQLVEPRHAWTPLLRAQRLLSVYSRLEFAWPAGVFTAEAAAPAAAPATELALVFISFIGHYTQQQQQLQPDKPLRIGPIMGLTPLVKALSVLHQTLVPQEMLKAGGRARSAQHRAAEEELRRSPHYLRGLTMLVTTLGYAELLAQHESLPGFVSTSSSSRSSSEDGAAASSCAARGNGTSSSGAAKQSSSSAAANQSSSSAAAGVVQKGLAGGFFSKGPSKSSSKRQTAAGSSKDAASAASAAAAHSTTSGGNCASGMDGDSTNNSSSTSKSSSSSTSKSSSSSSSRASPEQAAPAAPAAAAPVTSTAPGAASGSAKGPSDKRHSSSSKVVPQYEDRTLMHMIMCMRADIRDAAELAWRRAERRQQLTPASNRELLRLLVLDERMVLWLAEAGAKTTFQ
jgi:hypothetical protein